MSYHNPFKSEESKINYLLASLVCIGFIVAYQVSVQVTLNALIQF